MGQMNVTKTFSLHWSGLSFLFFFLSLFLVSSGPAYAQEDDRGYIVKTGDPAPDFTVTTTDGQVFTLSAFRGKVVMLQFTASWCGVCRKEMPHIEREIWQPLQSKGLVLIGLDRDEPVEVVREFGKKMKVSYPLAPDPDADVFALYALKQAGVTRNVIVDQEGRIAYLTRLYDIEEFNGMVDKIYELLDLERPPISRLSWLLGPWADQSDTVAFHENWEKVNDTVFSAFSYMTVHKDTVFSEDVLLVEKNGEVFYNVRAGGQNGGESVSFRLVDWSGGQFVFENKAHDFPQRIIYRSPSADSLYARIEGYSGGAFRYEEFPMKKVYTLPKH